MAEPTVVVPSIEEIFDSLQEAEAEERKELQQQSEAAVASSIAGPVFPRTVALPTIPREALGPSETVLDPDGKAINLITFDSIKVQDYVALYLVALLFEAGKDTRIGVVSANSSYRSTAKQKELYNKYQAYLADKTAYMATHSVIPVKAAAPGTSKHEFGLAIDFAINGVSQQNGKDFAGMSALAELGEKFGFKRTVWESKGIEPWHFEFIGSAINEDIAISVATAKVINIIITIINQAGETQKHAALMSYYGKFKAIARGRSLSVFTRAQHFASYSDQNQSSIEAEDKRGAALKRIYQQVSADVPVQTNFVGVLYNFKTGLWNDGKPNGRIETGSTEE